MRRTGFTLVELIAVMVVLGVLAAVAVPRFFDYTSRAKTASLQGSLGNIRSAISSYYADQSFSGTAAYPTLAQLTTTGTVLQSSIPANPYNNLSTVEEVTVLADANNRVTDDDTGWRYYVDNTATPPLAIFWANSSDTTTAPDPSGGNLTANEL